MHFLKFWEQEMQKNEPPYELDPQTRERFVQLAEQMNAIGIDPAGKSDLMLSYLATGARIARLRTAESTARGRNLERLARAVTAAQTELRKLHVLLLGRQEPEPPTTSEASAAADRKREADTAWRRFYWEGAGDDGDLRARFGEASWEAIMYSSLEDQAEAEREIEAYNRQRRQLDR